jgi:hypothetical protein
MDRAVSRVTGTIHLKTIISKNKIKLIHGDFVTYRLIRNSNRTQTMSAQSSRAPSPGATPSTNSTTIMHTFEATCSGDNLKVLSSAMSCLSKVGKDVTFQVQKDGMKLW